MARLRVAFDCDGTLRDYNNALRDDMCKLLIGFIASNQADVIVWSGGGKSYAQSVWQQVVRHYNLLDGMSDLVANVECKMKDGSKPDLTFDDEYVNLGTVNVRMRPTSEFD
jgi:hypothetical protein